MQNPCHRYHYTDIPIRGITYITPAPVRVIPFPPKSPCFIKQNIKTRVVLGLFKCFKGNRSTIGVYLTTETTSQFVTDRHLHRYHPPRRLTTACLLVLVQWQVLFEQDR